jgi:RimJ/RimL family protein N-acetyltransferase
MATKPILLDFPDEWHTQRLTIRAPRAGEGRIINEAIRASLPELQPWMPWAQEAPSVEESEELTRRWVADFQTREVLNFRIWLRDTPVFVGAISLQGINWKIPKFEIGYWQNSQHTGHGYMTEAVQSLTDFAFDTLNARRVVILCDDRNERSFRVAERCDFTLEGTHRHDDIDSGGNVRDTRIYARVR